MRWEDERRSDNIEDERGNAPAGGGFGLMGGGLGAVAVVVLALVLGVDPRPLLQLLGQGGHAPAATAPAPAAARPPANDPQRDFVAAVLGDTEDTWRAVFREGGKTYEDPRLVLFTGAVRSACGLAQSAVGPFYCPGDRKAYLDMAFFRDLRERFHAPGEFAEAYVIAHEVGHHVQNLLGISERVQALREARPEQANALSVRLELQADCLAGVWANRADKARHILEQGDVEGALKAASEIGDDRLQMRARGYVAPESFTHGSAAQRVHWFGKGVASGRVADCDTFRRGGASAGG